MSVDPDADFHAWCEQRLGAFGFESQPLGIQRLVSAAFHAGRQAKAVPRPMDDSLIDADTRHEIILDAQLTAATVAALENEGMTRAESIRIAETRLAAEIVRRGMTPPATPEKELWE